ncbi:hypothetical protein CEXT_110411 [Caerostris extrusa]|uniref:Uncharacterized protein n=1 Tax=Caerostris extrusa TaxID=172846 RepID=A0AAV4STQ8_CAEEX|nr:hypothetical protein CEXT_110411 [Caerostris extrusa]
MPLKADKEVLRSLSTARIRLTVPMRRKQPPLSKFLLERTLTPRNEFVVERANKNIRRTWNSFPGARKLNSN